MPLRSWPANCATGITWWLSNVSSIWQQAPAAAPITWADMVEVVLGLYVSRDYYIQEKTYSAPAFVEVAPGFKVQQRYYIQGKMYREEPAQ